MAQMNADKGMDYQKVVSIFCDVFARDAAQKTEALSRENEQLIPIYDEMTKFRLRRGEEVVAVVEISAIVDGVQDESYYVYRLENLPIIPLDESRSFSCELAGAVGAELPFRSPLPKLALLGDDNLMLKVTLTKDVVLFATLSEYAGTLQEVKHMVENHDYTHFFSMLGTRMVDAETGEPFMPMGMGHHPILGAVCHFHTLAIRKDAIASILDLNLPSAGEGKNYAEDLSTYSLAFPDHEFMEQATNQYSNERAKNQKLKAFREVYQTVQGVGVDGPLFELNLCDGKKGNIFIGLTQGELGNEVWKMEPSEQQATVLLSSLVDFSVTMGGATICDDFTSEWGGGASRMISFGHGFVLAYRPLFYVVEALFLFDDSANQYLEDEGAVQSFLPRVNRTLASDAANINPVFQPLEGMTVKLVGLHIGLKGIRTRLERLGVQVDAGVSEEQVDAGANEEAEGAEEVGEEESSS